MMIPHHSLTSLQVDKCLKNNNYYNPIAMNCNEYCQKLKYVYYDTNTQRDKQQDSCENITNQ